MLEFSFFDGIDWIAEWDTFTGQRRLPAALQITYRLESEEYPRSMTIKLPHSDITPEDPLVIEVAG